jgi:hypothetical protein
LVRNPSLKGLDFYPRIEKHRQIRKRSTWFW